MLQAFKYSSFIRQSGYPKYRAAGRFEVAVASPSYALASSLSPASVFTISDFMELLASGREHGGQRKALRPRLTLRNIAGPMRSPIFGRNLPYELMRTTD
jgi:hypothetical protein